MNHAHTTSTFNVPSNDDTVSDDATLYQMMSQESVDSAGDPTLALVDGAV